MEKKQKVKELAYAYCGAGKPYDPLNPPPMEMKYLAEVGAYCPSNDCYIMAEATIERAVLLTNNKKDFVLNKNISDDESSRLIGIMKINREFGYADEMGYVSRPFSIAAIGPVLKIPIDQLRLVFSNDDSKMRANLIEKYKARGKPTIAPCFFIIFWLFILSLYKLAFKS